MCSGQAVGTVYGGASVSDDVLVLFSAPYTIPAQVRSPKEQPVWSLFVAALQSKAIHLFGQAGWVLEHVWSWQAAMEGA